MEDTNIGMPHTLYIDNRNKLTLTGVTDVGSFNEDSLRIETNLGEINISGTDLQVSKLSLESGEVTVEGKINSVVYSETVRKGGAGFFSRVLG